MKSLLLAFASAALVAQAPAGDCWSALLSRVPAALRAAGPATSDPKPPMEILVRVPGARLPAAGEMEVTPEQIKGLEVYSRTQARAIGEGLVTPSGDPLVFHSLYKRRYMSRSGLILRDDAGAILLVDPKGVRWSLVFSVSGPTWTGDWTAEPACSEACSKLKALVLAGDWAQAMDGRLRDKVRKTSPNEVLVVALDLLADLDRPAGREAALLASSAKLASLQPRNADALRLCAAAAMAAGRPEEAGRLRAWMAGLH